MAQAFSQASQVRLVAPGHFELEVPDAWQQGRGAFGGLVLGTLSRAMQQATPGNEAQRTLTGSICGPVLPGATRIDVETLRAGKRLTFVRATMRQGQDFEQIKATATATIGGSRPVEARDFAPTPPELGDWHSTQVLPMAPPMGPIFTQHYEYRSSGPFPFSGGDQAVAQGWIRSQADPEVHDTPALLGMLDAFWPAEFSLESAPRPMATVSFTAEFFAQPHELKGSDPYAYRARTIATREGFGTEFRELWRDGRLVAMNQQTFVALG